MSGCPVRSALRSLLAFAPSTLPDTLEEQVNSRSSGRASSSSAQEGSAAPSCCTSLPQASVCPLSAPRNSSRVGADGTTTGQITIVDHDTVELSNLHRQVLHTEARVGMSKAQSARLALEACVASPAPLHFPLLTRLRLTVSTRTLPSTHTSSPSRPRSSTLRSPAPPRPPRPSSLATFPSSSTVPTTPPRASSSTPTPSRTGSRSSAVGPSAPRA